MSSISRNSFGDDEDDRVDSVVEKSSQEPSKQSTDKGDRGTEDIGHGNGLHIPSSDSLALLGASTLPDLDARQHSTFFYLSLIEGRCRAQAANLINAGRRSKEHLPDTHPEVRDLARHLFAEMSKELHKAGILPDEFASQNLEKLRTQYLNSFDNILHNIAAKRTKDVVDLDVYGSITNSDVFTVSNRSTSYETRALAGQELAIMPSKQSPSLTSSHLRRLVSFYLENNQNKTVEQSIYNTEYDQIEVIGKGGFGRVYKVVSLVDRQSYAVKKVVMRGINLNLMRGMSREAIEQKMETMLAEVLALSRLRHTNVVRYFHAWVELCEPGMTRGSIQQVDTSDSGAESSIESESVAEALGSFKLSVAGDPSKNDFGASSYANADYQVLFEDTKQPATTSSHAVKQSTSDTNAPKALVKSPPMESSSFSDPMGIPQSRQIVFDAILYIKMDFHPLSLEDFLWSDKRNWGGISVPRHCYHAAPAAKMGLAILDGVRYIHSKKIIHRDLKPANIFLSVDQDPEDEFHGSVVITECSDCGDRPDPRIVITPHIGDFGLVKKFEDIEHDTTPAAETSGPSQLAVVPSKRSKQAGTTFYVPPYADKEICPKLDVYSLGVILFELVTKFGSQSERIKVLGDLGSQSEDSKRYPDNFEENEMATGIKAMLCAKREERWDCNQVRKWLVNILAKHA